MVDLVDILFEAQNKNSVWSKNRLTLIIEQDVQFVYDWDRECGERWASIQMNNKFVGYINCFSPLCFCQKDAIKEIKSAFGDETVIIAENDFDTKKWFINEEKINRKLSELSWIVQEGVLDINAFSINDLWYATL
ncbi:MAG: hypothetical protein K2K70_09100 [Lachnospiraceae bacterium]|nr:hypothetical protein [Lachnospiraceae bacterium]